MMNWSTHISSHHTVKSREIACDGINACASYALSRRRIRICRCEEADAYCCNKCIASAASPSRRWSIGADSTALFVPARIISELCTYILRNGELRRVSSSVAGFTVPRRMRALFRYKMMMQEPKSTSVTEIIMMVIYLSDRIYRIYVW